MVYDYLSKIVYYVSSDLTGHTKQLRGWKSPRFGRLHSVNSNPSRIPTREELEARKGKFPVNFFFFLHCENLLQVNK